MAEELYAVVTTIQATTPALASLEKKLIEVGGTLIVAGDAKSPDSMDLAEGNHFMTVASQLGSGFELAGKLPLNHYGRKNIGYLEAIRRGARVIYETDDDNAPLESWSVRSREVEAVGCDHDGWVNVYRYFSAAKIWPRGLPLDEVNAPTPETSSVSTVRSPLQQGLADGSPDVDAVWRLVLDEPVVFDRRESVYLDSGAWCPFNSQSTWWWPEAYALMYLPSYCSFRMTDIWRSFIAQRCLWELGYGVVFHASEVVQERNVHVLMRDFADEIPGYLRNREIAHLLENLSLRSGTEHLNDNLLSCYEALIAREVFPDKELPLVESWLRDVDAIS